MENKIKRVNQLKGTENGEEKSGRLSLAKTSYIAISLILTICLFVGLLMARDYLSKDVSYVAKVVVKNTVPAGEVITEENCGTYFAIKNIPSDMDVDSSYSKIEDMVGFRSRVDLEKGEVVAAKDFVALNKYTDNIKNPVLTGLEVASIANSVGGSLRTGDIINIQIIASAPVYHEVTENATVEANDISRSKTGNGVDSVEADDTATTDVTDQPEVSDHVKEVTEEELSWSIDKTGLSEDGNTDDEEGYESYILHNVYVTEARDGNGVLIANTDSETAATVLMLTLSEDASQALNEALTKGAVVKVEKVLNPDADTAE